MDLKKILYSSESEYSDEEVWLWYGTHSRFLWNSSTSSDSNDDDEENTSRAPKSFKERPSYLHLSEAEFTEKFRLSKAAFSFVLQHIQEDLTFMSKRGCPVSPTNQLLLVLRLLATGGMLSTVGDLFGVHKSTACQIVKRVLSAICKLARDHIKMPSNADDILRKQEEFFLLDKFPNVIGAIGCTHIKIQSPGGDSGDHFRNKNGFFSLHVQIIADANLNIQSVVARWPGSTPVQTIFANSRVCQDFEAGKFNSSVLLGDSEYDLRKYLITPLQNPSNLGEMLFQESQDKTRNPVERLFELWKRRFCVLTKGIRLTVNTAQKIVIACAVLHNVIQKFKSDSASDVVHTGKINSVNLNNDNFREPFIQYFSDL